jgi:aspartyl-tRNA(Asn)/glutamyl-tRNA(Gln) amidotransferase subunit A
MENDQELTITRLAPLIQKKKLSPVELTSFILDRIQRLQPQINAYITITAEVALQQAKKAEKEIAKGKYRGALHGIPVNFKDLFFTRGIRTTGGSKILARFVPQESSAVVDRILGSGSILLGKTNLHEFAYGATNVNPHYGPVRNPWDTKHMSGGSSGGSAASVISAQAVASFGTDTGGSIRIPSAACGCVGLKPTYGLIPLEGVIPLAPSLDHAGPLCRSVADAAILFEALCGKSIADSKTLERLLRELRRGVKGLRIGVPRQYFFDCIQLEVRGCISTAIAEFERLGGRLIGVDLPGMEDTARLGAEITAGEASVYHGKWIDCRLADYGDDVRSRLEQSRFMTASVYIQAEWSRQAYSARFAHAMEKVDLLLTPTIPVVAPRIEQRKVQIGRTRIDVRTALLSLTRPLNLCGLPAISVPCGFSTDGLPVGLQIIGRRLDEPTLLRAAFAYEGATRWHRMFPGETNPL